MATTATTFEFIESNPMSNLKPGKSLQIRSRCMQGRNRHERSRRTQQSKNKAAKEKEDEVVSKRIKRPVLSMAHGMLPPGSLLGDLALIRFADPDIKLETRNSLFKAFAYDFANQALSPLDSCINFDRLDPLAFGLLLSDNAFLHSVLCASHAINDFQTPQWDGNPSRQTLLHLRKTLSLLQAKLYDERLDDSVLQVVLNLSLLAASYGDWGAAVAHFNGLHKIVQLKGGLAFLRARPKLHFKLDRIDLARSLSSGKKPLFLDCKISWESIISPYSLLSTGIFKPPPEWTLGLANVFRDFQNLTLRTNGNARKRARHNAFYFQGFLTSLQSRLIHLGDYLVNSLEKLVRLAMLCLLTTMVKVPGRKLPYLWINEQLRDTYAKTAGGLCEINTSLRLWLLVTVALTITRAKADWIVDAWGKTELGLDWAKVKNHLMQVMWIEIIHDKSGETVFQELEGSRLVYGGTSVKFGAEQGPISCHEHYLAR